MGTENDAQLTVLDRKSPTPLYLQLEEALEERIVSGEWEIDTPIPSENELSQAYGLSRMTTRNVITRLVMQGLLYRVAGKGTFVAAPKIANKADLPVGIHRQLEELGMTSRVRLISAERIIAPTKIRRRLELNPGSEVWAIERLRIVQDKPLSIHKSYVPLNFAPNLDQHHLEADQLSEILKEEYQLQPSHVQESVETALANEREAELLNCDPGFTLLQLDEINLLEDKTPYEYCHVVFRGDRARITFDFSRGSVSTTTDPATDS